MACSPVTEAPPDARGETACDRYCDVIMSACTSVPQYTSREACFAYCDDFAKLPIGVEDDQEGNSVECRIYHATVASATSPELHCPHAGQSGGGVCGTYCENYCHLMLENCTTYDATGEAACLTECGSVPDTGEPNGMTGNNIQCRIHFAGLAGAEQATADALCAAADITTSGECVDP